MKVHAPKQGAVLYGGSCSDEYSKDYEALLNWPGNTDVRAACDDFYAKYANVRCFSQVDGAELRIHTGDFDEKCQRGSSGRPKSTKQASDSGDLSDSSRNCIADVAKFIKTRKSEFYSVLATFQNDAYIDDKKFASSLENRKICNQYFLNYKYKQCALDGVEYSYYDLKPYCDEFQTTLHRLKLKTPKKFSPQELKSVVGLNLKFHFEDPLVPFYRSKDKVKPTYFVEGRQVDFSNITSNQSYCYLESDRIRYAGELKNDIYKVDITQISKNKIMFTHTSFNEKWRMICQSPEYFYFQDLVEVLGDAINVLE